MLLLFTKISRTTLELNLTKKFQLNEGDRMKAKFLLMLLVSLQEIIFFLNWGCEKESCNTIHRLYILQERHMWIKSCLLHRVKALVPSFAWCTKSKHLKHLEVERQIFIGMIERITRELADSNVFGIPVMLPEGKGGCLPNILESATLKQ